MQRDPESAREECGLAEALHERRSGELHLLEDLAIGEERDRRPRLRRLADDLEVGLRDATRELLAVDLPVAAHLGDEPLAERVHDRETDAVETAGDLVAVPAELPAGVELRQDDGQGGLPLVLHHVDRDAPAGVGDGDRVVRVDRHVDALVVTRHGLVDGVVDELVDEVVEPSRAGRADVHPGSQADGLEALEDRDVLSGVGGVRHKPPDKKMPAK